MATQACKRSDGIIFAALMPHAPILIPDIGEENLRSAKHTVAALRLTASRLMDRDPEALVIISPHSPRKRGAFGVWSADDLRGDFGQFGAPDVRLALPNNRALATSIQAHAQNAGLELWEISHQPLDHGALVPLWFLVEAGWSNATAVLSLNYPGEGGLVELGSAIAAASKGFGQRIALIASGDMSHRLTPRAPAGYDPRASEFDREFIACLRRGGYRELDHFDPELTELAAEDALDSTLAAVAAVDWQPTGHEVLSYEGPFGVGYGVAVLFDIGDASDEAAPFGEECRKTWAETLPGAARESVKAALFDSKEPVPPPHRSAQNDCLHLRRGVFVTIRTADGELRGCVGTLYPRCQDVVAETQQVARSAAFHDSRFSPVTRAEFPDLRFEVSVIGPLEKIASEDELDPARYGVIMSTRDGRQACLLPGIPEIQTVQQQLDIVRRKGCIQRGESVQLQRFTSVKVTEPEDH